MAKTELPYCFNCQKDGKEVAVLVGLKDAYICNECVCLCMKRISEHGRMQFEDAEKLKQLIYMQEILG